MKGVQIQQGNEKMTRTSNKLRLVKTNFSMKAFASLKTNEYANLSTTAWSVFHFVGNFGKLHQIKDFVCISILEHLTQKLEALTSGPFQVYFFNNVFKTDKNSRIQKHNKLTEKTIETSINEIFTLDQEENEKAIQEYIELMNIKVEWKHWHLFEQKQSWFIQYCWIWTGKNCW